MINQQRSRAGLIVLAIALSVDSGGAIAGAAVHSVSTAGHATITILRPTSTSLMSGLSFGSLRSNGARATGGTVTIASAPPYALAVVGAKRAGGAPSPAIYSIKGEKSRTYTVSFPSTSVTSTPGGYRVSNFTLWSANSGVITSRGIGRLSALGTDTLRVGATISVPSGLRPTTITAVIPITIVAQ